MKKSLFFLVLTTILFSMNLQAQNPNKAYVVDSVATCDSLKWINGITYYEDANVFYNTNDTVHVLILSVKHSITTTAPDETRGCVFQWHNRSYTSTGVYTDTVTASNGCDSVITLSLTISGTQRDTLDEVTACGSYTWMDRTLDASDFYSDTTEVEQYNCDSIVVLPLTIASTITFPDDTVRSCKEYIWHDTTYTETGKFTRVRRDEAIDCDSIYTLVLTIVPLQVVEDTIDTVKCGSLAYRFEGDPASAIYRLRADQTIQKLFENHDVEVCRDSLSVVRCHVKPVARHTEVVNECDFFEWNNKTYTINATDSLIISKGAANGCDSIVHMDIHIAPSPVISNIGGDLRLSTPGEATLYASCNQSGVEYTWEFSNGDSYEGDTVSAYVSTTTDVRLTVTNLQTNCTSEHWLVILVGVGIDNVENTAIRIYPNPTTARININSDNEVREAVIYNTLGQIVSRINMEGRNDVEVSGLTNGTYTLQLMMQNGEMSNHRFVVSK